MVLGTGLLALSLLGAAVGLNRLSRRWRTLLMALAALMLTLIAAFSTLGEDVKVVAFAGLLMLLAVDYKWTLEIDELYPSSCDGSRRLARAGVISRRVNGLINFVAGWRRSVVIRRCYFTRSRLWAQSVPLPPIFETEGADHGSVKVMLAQTFPSAMENCSFEISDGPLKGRTFRFDKFKDGLLLLDCLSNHTADVMPFDLDGELILDGEAWRGLTFGAAVIWNPTGRDAPPEISQFASRRAWRMDSPRPRSVNYQCPGCRSVKILPRPPHGRGGRSRKVP